MPIIMRSNAFAAMKPAVFSVLGIIPGAVQGYTLASMSRQNVRSFTTSPTSADNADSPLYFEFIGGHSPRTEPVIVFLHGLLGNGRNMHSFAKQFCERQQARGVLVDLPGHGKSKGRPNQSDTTVDGCITDLQKTLDIVGIAGTERDWTLVGHSMGGRIAMHYADQKILPQPERLILLDTVPGRPSPKVMHVMSVAEEIAPQLKMTPKTHNELTDQLVNRHGIDMATAQWLASSFNPRTREFNFDIEAAKALVREFLHVKEAADDNDAFLERMHRILTQNPGILRVDLVRGGKNDSWDLAAKQLEEMAKWTSAPPIGSISAFFMHVLPKAGHWVHVDDLPGLLDALDTW